MVVLFPAPLGPSRPNVSPSRMSNDTPATAVIGPNDLPQLTNFDHV